MSKHLGVRTTNPAAKTFTHSPSFDFRISSGLEEYRRAGFSWLVRKQMAEHASLLSEVAPTCAKCRSPMALRRLRAGRLHYKGEFKCDACGYTITKPIELALSASPLLAASTSSDNQT